jgi:hypothetical protein
MGKAGDKPTTKSLLDLPSSAEPPLTPEQSVEVLHWMIESGARSFSGYFERERQAQQRLADLTFAAAAPTPVSKLAGKEWVRAAFERRAEELRVMRITDAGRALSAESQKAPDCAKPLSVGYCTNLLRGLVVRPKKPRDLR